MVDAHASGACEETHGGSSPFIGKFFKQKKVGGKDFFTPVVLANNGGLPVRVSCSVRLEVYPKKWTTKKSEYDIKQKGYKRWKNLQKKKKQ